MTGPSRTLIRCAAAAAWLGLAGCAQGAEARHAIAVVTAFNEALSHGDADAALARVAPEAVQFNLRPSHAGGDSTLVQSLPALWRTVSAVLSANVESYERVATVRSVEVSGDVATVWTATRTATRRKGAAEPAVLEFSEVYLLLRLGGEWRIAGTANNRPSSAP